MPDASIYDIIRSPVITEKSTNMTELNKYSFRVLPAVNKAQIKKAVEQLFRVHVVKVNTVKMPGKKKRVRFRQGKTADWKKVIVTVRKGEKIEFA